MANLRALAINAADSRTIKAKFSENLAVNISAQNVLVEGIEESTPDALVRAAIVSGNVLIITVLPMTPYVKYRVTFRSAPGVPFVSQSGTSFLVQDGTDNVKQVLGAENPSNYIRDNLVSYLSGQPYAPERGTLIRDLFNEISTSFLRATYDIRQSKNDNYLSFFVTDERKQRSFGPYDRLNEEGAFVVSRVGLTPSNKTLAGSIPYTSFPSDIITLQQRSVEDERLFAGFGNGTFDKFTLSTSRYPVTKIDAVSILYQDGSTFEYDIRSFGYQIKEPKYDTEFASTLLSLEDNQFKLNEEVLGETGFKVPQSGDFVSISYQFKSLGRVIDDASVAVSQVLSATREATPALSTSFTLPHFPIVNISDTVPTLGGVLFLDPSSETPFKTVHPAFLNELVFKVDALPRRAGDYSIDYSTGRVFVYGASTNDGSGYFPPAATYLYRNTFRRDLDYTYRDETRELVASPLRDLVGQIARITFLFEETLVEGIDYKTGIHAESLNERIGNKLISGNSLRVANAPITNVFRIYNETSGEIYRINRFVNDKIVFSASNPPNVQNKTFERSSFAFQTNEQLIFSSEMLNTLGTRVFRVSLLNQNIMSASEDVIGSSYNTSVVLSRNDIFERELFYEGQIIGELANINKLTVGDYLVDYRNGNLFVGVSPGQDFALGTITYRKPVISPSNPHVLAVSEIFYSINPAQGITKKLNYSSFEDGAIYPSIIDVSDERFLNGDQSLPYSVSAGTITVTDDVKTVRSIFDNYDLNNNLEPVNFGSTATASGNVITLDTAGVEILAENITVGAGLTVTINTGSPGISLNTVSSVVRTSDSQQLLDGYQTIAGDVITLSVTSGAAPGDIVSVIYRAILNSSATPIVDYDRGEHFINYTYLADEILVSYEYGDNVIDFRESTAIDAGQIYYVNYRVGALRDSLLANFGSLIDIPELNTFDVDLERERYRDALIGALQSFTRGPTNPSMKDMVAEVTKIQPQIIESAFQYWSLGITPLYRGAFKLSIPPTDPLKENPNDPSEIPGTPTVKRVFVSGKFDGGYLPSVDGDYISFPVSSNLSLNQGTMELTVVPEWDGLDNDAVLSFTNLSKDGYALAASQIFIGSTSYNPTLVDGVFEVSRLDAISPVGLPSAVYTSTGIFIYYDEDAKRWHVLAKDYSVITDGYSYTGDIISSGEVYDVAPIPGLADIDDVIRSTQEKISFVFNINSNDGYSPDGYAVGDGYVSGFSFDGLTFMADSLHYFFDFAEDESKNRFSLYKDGKGYLNFTVWDNGGGYAVNQNRRSRYVVSADIQDWETGEEHSIGISWRLNNKDRRDEMHLFIDGQEVPNIIRYGGIPSAVSSNRFRTVNPEVVAGTVTLNAVAGIMVTTQGSADVVGLGVDFGVEGIVPGNQITIQELGFSTYTILAVNGPTLTLDTVMPATLGDARFTVNPASFVVSSEVDIYKNIAVSTLLGGTETEIPGLRAVIPGYEISKNSLNQNVLTILGNATAGSQILIRTFGLNHRRCREKVYLWSDQAVLKTQLPPPINLDEVSIRSVIQPYIVLSPDNSIINLGNFELTINPTATSNSIEGRSLEVRVSGGNVDFTTPTTVTLTGTSTGGPIEVLSFSAPGTQITANKWLEVTDGYVVTTPITTARSGAGIEIKEAYSVTVSNGNNLYPVIRFGYQTQSGLTLQGDGSDIVSDPNGFFPASEVDNILVIESPPAVAGNYKIIERIDSTTVRLLTATGSAFTDGAYKSLNVTIGRSGFQNGFFFMEQAGTVNVAYPLPQGFYEFDFSTFLEVPFAPLSNRLAYIGSDFRGHNQAKATIDEFRILSTQLSDTRVGETIGINDESITTGAAKIRPFKKNTQTLVLLHFDEFPIINDSDYYTFAERTFLQSSTSVNQNFDQSICFENSGLSYDNKNRLTTESEGTIEFWVSPMFDTFNDPIPRVYFDASASVVEEVTSLTRGTVKISGRASEVLSVRLVGDIQKTGQDYFVGGALESDFQTVSLGTALPFQQTPVLVTYVPTGVQGDRVTILKDSEGFISFNVVAGGVLFQVRQPVFWARDTWHRVKATFKFNTVSNLDEIRLFVDGEERGSVRFGDDIVFGGGLNFGATRSGVTAQILIANIDFRDLITRFHIGQDFTGSFPAHARMDNFRLSNKSLDSLVIAGQATDVNFSTNVECIYPVIENAYTTMLLDFDRVIQKVEDFAILRDSRYGIFNFTINVIDSFSIVEDSEKVRSMLEAMIYALKPANAKVDIIYVR